MDRHLAFTALCIASNANALKRKITVITPFKVIEGHCHGGEQNILSSVSVYSNSFSLINLQPLQVHIAFRDIFKFNHLIISLSSYSSSG